MSVQMAGPARGSPEAVVRRLVMARLLLCAAVISLSTVESQAAARFHLASQYSYATNQGFCLDLEGNELASLPISLWVGDGESWRSPGYVPGFEFDRDYLLAATITPSGAAVTLDGLTVISSPGRWLPAPASLELGHWPTGEGEQGDWVAVVGDLTIVLTRDGREVARHTLTLADAAREVPLQLFQPRPADCVAMESQPGDALTIEARLRFGRSDLQAWAPFIDRYGQCTYAEFAGKVRSDADLVADVAEEQAILATMPPSPDFDQYGGYLRAGWGEDATGFFRVVKRDGYWWLISPEGNPCFYVGMDNLAGAPTAVTGREFLFEWLPPREDPWSAAWLRDPWEVGAPVDAVDLYASNLIRKYGEDNWWAEAEQVGLDRLRSWGFSGGGKWNARPSIVSTPVLLASNTPTLAGHPDFFDAAIRDIFRQDLAACIEPRRNDPNILGVSLGSEHDALITRQEIRDILAKPADTASKRAILDRAVDDLYGGSVATLSAAWGLSASSRDELYAASPEPPDADTEDLRCWYEEQYYSFVYATMKEIAPNHLYIASWIVPGWWESEEDWRILARHCDIMGYDRYAMSYDDEDLARLKAEIDVPTFVGEFSFPPTYGFERGYGLYHSSEAADDGDAGDRYQAWLTAAAADPSCVGLSWFQYVDQPLTGRGLGREAGLVYGEHYAFGVVTVTDRPKWALVQKMRETNLRAALKRVLAMTGGCFLDVPGDYWAADQIAACVQAGIVSGYSAEIYGPELPITRDQMAVFISRALAGRDSDVPTGPATATFRDVAADHWAFKYIEYVAANNVVRGYEDGTYRPSNQVDRGQMAVFVARSMVTPTGDDGLAHYTPPALPSFADVPTDHWAYRYIEYIAQDGVAVARGYGDGTYRPSVICTRGQMAVYVQRAFGLPM